MKPTLCMCIVGLALIGYLAAQDNTPDEEAATQKLGVLLGKWQSEGKIFDTAYTKSGKLSGNLDCTWSPQRNFLTCEQLVTDSNGKHKRLTVYSYNAKAKNYDIRTMVEPGMLPWYATFTIEGNIWTITSSNQVNGRKLEFRTIIDFSSPGTQLSKTERSDDGGAHWTVTIQSTANRTAK